MCKRSPEVGTFRICLFSSLSNLSRNIVFSTVLSSVVHATFGWICLHVIKWPLQFLLSLHTPLNQYKNRDYFILGFLLRMRSYFHKLSSCLLIWLELHHICIPKPISDYLKRTRITESDQDFTTESSGVK